MIKHKSQRVGVFIDVQNMYYSARKLYGHKVNFGEILKAAEAERQLIRAIAYVVRATGDEGGFFEALNARGMETKVRDVQIFEDGARKADWDVGMVVDMIRISEVLDTVVIVSGDGDFVELVEYLKHHGKQVEVIAFRETSSAKLIATVDDFTNLSDDTKRFLIGATAVEPSEPRRPQGTPKHRSVPVIIHDDTDLSAMGNVPATPAPAAAPAKAAVPKPPQKPQRQQPKPQQKPQPQRPVVIPAKAMTQKPPAQPPKAVQQPPKPPQKPQNQQGNQQRQGGGGRPQQRPQQRKPQPNQNQHRGYNSPAV
jgi:uncharacterized LabA/DUF88 family protein